MNVTIGKTLRVLTWILGAGLTIAALLSGLFAALLATVGAQGTDWYFPGDPAWADLGLIAGVFAVVVAGVLCWLSFRFNARLRALAIVNAVIITISGAALLVCAGAIAFRLTPAWAELRHKIRWYGDEIAAAAGDRHHVLTHEEFEAFQEKFVPQAVPVQLGGYGTVHLQMTSGVYPYVGIEFGRGGYALFDPTTMWCIYAD